MDRDQVLNNFKKEINNKIKNLIDETFNNEINNRFEIVIITNQLISQIRDLCK